MIALLYITFAFALMYALWVFYLAVMNLQRVRDMGKLTPVALAFGYPVLIIGLVLDFLVNVFVMTFLLLEIPQETTVTSRLKRHHKESTGWRLAIVLFIEPLLDPFDPSGDHI